MTRAEPLAPVLVAGCGRSGARLAARLARAGQPVVALDRDPLALAGLGRESSGAGLLERDALDPTTWELPEARAARVVLGCLGGDPPNLALAALLQALGRGPVLLALRDPGPDLLATARALGAEAVCATALADEALLAAALTRPPAGSRPPAR